MTVSNINQNGIFYIIFSEEMDLSSFIPYVSVDERKLNQIDKC